MLSRPVPGSKRCGNSTHSRWWRPLFGRGSRRFALGAGIPDGSCVAVQAHYVFDAFGKFPGAVPSVFILNYVRAHHLDLDFYGRIFRPGAYLRIDARHMQRWHGGPEGG